MLALDGYVEPTRDGSCVIGNASMLIDPGNPPQPDHSRLDWSRDQSRRATVKRSGPLRRLTPLRTRSALRRSKPIERSVGDQLRRTTRKRKALGVPSEIREQVLQRDRGCRAQRLVTDIRCWGPIDPHHVLRRSQGGPDTVENLISVCRAHHDWIHQHPARSYDLGLLRRSGDA
jgi:hypothetical protein